MVKSILKTVVFGLLVSVVPVPMLAMKSKDSKAKTSKRKKGYKKRKNDKVKVFCCAHYETICPTGYCSKADWKKRWVSKAHLNRYTIRYK